MLDELFNRVSEVRIRGRKYHRDHFTLFGFSTHWKATFDMIKLDDGGREQVRRLTAFKTPAEAIENAIQTERRKVLVNQDPFDLGEIIRGAYAQAERQEMNLEIDRLIVENEKLEAENKRLRHIIRELFKEDI